jgi:hypothetical protein
MIADGIIEKVYVPAKIAPGKQRGKDVLCARLISESGNPSIASRNLAEREDAGDAELEQGSHIFRQCGSRPVSDLFLWTLKLLRISLSGMSLSTVKSLLYWRRLVREE